MIELRLLCGPTKVIVNQYLAYGQVHTERSPGTRLSFGPNEAPVIFGYPLHNGQANARARILISSMQPLEHLHDLVRVLLIEPNTIVAQNTPPHGWQRVATAARPPALVAGR